MKVFVKILFVLGLFCINNNLKSQINPSSVSGLTLWFTGDSIQMITPPFVDKIFDLSSSLNHALQTDTSFQPVIINTYLNGRQAIQFDGINDFLRFNLIPDIRTVFWVIKENSTATLNFRALLGSSLTYDFYRSGYTLWDATFTSNFILAGETRINSNVINGLTTSMPNNYSIISLITTGNVQADNFSNDRNLLRTWDGELAELIVYNQPLTIAEVTQVEQYLGNKYAPPIELPNDIIVSNSVCDTTISTINPEGNTYLYEWSNGSNTSSISVQKSGTYWVSATNIFGFTSYDTINVYFPSPSYPDDNFLCIGTTEIWNTNLSTSIFNFEWSNASTDSLLNITQPGDYWVKVTDTLGCFQYSDTISISVDSFPTETTLGIDKTVCQGSTIGLETGVGVISYLWNTNDTSAQITIDTAGIYWIQVENNNGCIANDTVLIAVSGIAPTVSFNVQDNCVNKTVAFNNTSFTTDGSNIISSFWTFGTGDTSNLQNPAYNYLATGNYNVTLQIQTDSGCTNTLTQQIQVYKKPTAGFFPANSLMCSDQNALFTNNSFSSDGVINSWLWDFGVAGNTDTSSLQNGSYAYAITGNYTVQLIVSTEFGCSDTVLNLINVKPSPIANFVFQDSCLTNQTKFTNLSTGTISMTNWDFGDANSSALLNPSHVYANSGSYNVILAIKATNGCWDTLIKPVGIYDNPIANFVTDDYCVLSNNQLFDSSITNAGVLTNWNWNISSLSFQSSNQNPIINFNFADSGLFQLKLKVTNNYGCIDSITKTIGVYPLPIPNFNFSPEIGLPPLQVNFNNQTYGGNSYLWDFNDGNSSIVISPIYTFQDSGIFIVTLFATSLYGCVDSISKTIQIIEPVIDLAVKNIYYEFVPNSNFMKMSVQFANEGRVTIQNMELILQNSSTGSILETWNGNLAPNLQNIYTFSSMIEMPNGEIPSLICVNATNINHGIDADLSNNEFCKALDKFELINLYPNPTSKNLFLEFISPQQSDLEINLFNNVGKLVSTLFKGQSSKGINRLNFLMSIYAQGVYVIEIKNQDEIIRKKFMVN